MNTGIIASRYAEALLKYADENSAADTVLQQVRILSSALSSCLPLRNAVYNPQTGRVAEKVALLAKVLGREKISPVLERFLTLVFDNDRGRYLRYILNSFMLRYNESRGISEACLTLAMASDAMEEEIRRFFSVKSGGSLEMEVKVDPSLIGGFVLEVNDGKIDASVATRLAKIKRSLVAKNNSVK